MSPSEEEPLAEAEERATTEEPSKRADAAEPVQLGVDDVGEFPAEDKDTVERLDEEAPAAAEVGRRAPSRNIGERVEGGPGSGECKTVDPLEELTVKIQALEVEELESLKRQGPYIAAS